uniref:chitinase n=1 Tax=Glossina morsitans morsitans TaxID=37546 RepID=A0A1B0FFE7_GLOMM
MKPFDKYQDIEQGGYAKFTGLKTYNKQLKTMIAIGGWNEASSRFSPLVANPERRQKFIKNILKFLRQNHFDGIDLDWEYPAHREGGKPGDRDNYAQFVQELRAEFERESEKTGRQRLLLTMAVPAGIEYIEKGYDIPKLNKYLDWFNVLTYDFHSSHEPSVNHHAPLYPLEEDSEYNYDAELNIDYSIKYYLKAGADRNKLVLGIPTYGRSYTLINEESTEIGAPAEGPGEQGDATREKGYLAFYEICNNIKEDPDWEVVQPNINAMGPYAYRRTQWVGYDDEAIVRKKAQYVVEHGLGGIMFWSIDNDDFRGTCTGKPYPLIEAAKESMFDAMGLGINEVSKSSAPRKSNRSRNHENSIGTRNRINVGDKLTYEERKESSRRTSNQETRKRLQHSTPRSPSSTTIRLTEAEGSSLYIGGRTTTPPPPTTPDPGTDFKCEDEGFYQHPRDCKKYYWCLDSGPSGLGIVAHQFTCPSGLYFNPAADSCDFARNVPCKTKKSTTAAPVTKSYAGTSVATTAKPTASVNRITAATARTTFFRTTSTTAHTTTTTAKPPVEEEDYMDVEEQHSEEDPKVIKELIELIRRVGGIEELEKHLLRKDDGTISFKQQSSSSSNYAESTTSSSISKSLYDKVLSRPNALNSFRNRFIPSNSYRKTEQFDREKSDEESEIANENDTNNSKSTSEYSKYSSVVRGNSRQGPQNEGLDKLPEFSGFLKERKQYVTINRNRGSQKKIERVESDEEEIAATIRSEQITDKPFSVTTPSYTSIRRTRPSTTASLIEEEDFKDTTITKPRASLSRMHTTDASSEQADVNEDLALVKYKYLERARSNAEDSQADKLNENKKNEEQDADITHQKEDQKITVQLSAAKADYSTQQLQEQVTTIPVTQRTYVSLGRRTTTTASNTETSTPVVLVTTTPTETSTAAPNNIENLTYQPLIALTTTIATTTTNLPATITNTSPSITIIPSITSDLLSSSKVLKQEYQLSQSTLPDSPTPDSTATTLTTEYNLQAIKHETDSPAITVTTEKFSTPTIPGLTDNKDEVNLVIRDQNQSTVYNKIMRDTTPVITNTLTTITEKYTSFTNRNNTDSLSSPNTAYKYFGGKREKDQQKVLSRSSLKQTTELYPLTTTITNESINNEFLGSVSSPRPFGYPKRRGRPTVSSTTTVATEVTSVKTQTKERPSFVQKAKLNAAVTPPTKVSSNIDHLSQNYEMNPLGKELHNHDLSTTIRSLDYLQYSSKENKEKQVLGDAIVEQDIGLEVDNEKEHLVDNNTKEYGTNIVDKANGNLIRQRNYLGKNTSLEVDLIETQYLNLNRTSITYTDVIRNRTVNNQKENFPLAERDKENSENQNKQILNKENTSDLGSAGKSDITVENNESSIQVTENPINPNKQIEMEKISIESVESQILKPLIEEKPKTKEIYKLNYVKEVTTTSNELLSDSELGRENNASNNEENSQSSKNATSLEDVMLTVTTAALAYKKNTSVQLDGEDITIKSIYNDNGNESNVNEAPTYNDILVTSSTEAVSIRNVVTKTEPVMEENEDSLKTSESATGFNSSRSIFKFSEEHSQDITSSGKSSEVEHLNPNMDSISVSDQNESQGFSNKLKANVERFEGSLLNVVQRNYQIPQEITLPQKDQKKLKLEVKQNPSPLIHEKFKTQELDELKTLGIRVDSKIDKSLDFHSQVYAENKERNDSKHQFGINKSKLFNSDLETVKANIDTKYQNPSENVDPLIPLVTNKENQKSIASELNTKSSLNSQNRSYWGANNYSKQNLSRKNTTFSSRRNLINRKSNAQTKHSASVVENESITINKLGDSNQNSTIRELSKTRKAPLRQPYRSRNSIANVSQEQSQHLQPSASNQVSQSIAANPALKRKVLRPRNQNTSNKTEEIEKLANGTTIIRTIYIDTVSTGPNTIKTTKRIKTKILQKQAPEYEDEDEIKAADVTHRSIVSNRGSAKFRSNDLSSILALDLSFKAQKRREDEQKNRRKFLRRPVVVSETEDIEEFETELAADPNFLDNSVKSLKTSTMDPLAVASSQLLLSYNKTPNLRELSTANSIVNLKNRGTAQHFSFAGLSTLPKLNNAATSTVTKLFPASTEILPIDGERTIKGIESDIFEANANAETTNSDSHDQNNFDELSLPVYHRRKYYQYYKDSPIPYTSPIESSSAIIESTPPNIAKQIHDVFNISANQLESDESEKATTESSTAEEERKITQEYDHFLMTHPRPTKVKDSEETKTSRNMGEVEIENRPDSLLENLATFNKTNKPVIRKLVSSEYISINGQTANKIINITDQPDPENLLTKNITKYIPKFTAWNHSIENNSTEEKTRFLTNLFNISKGDQFLHHLNNTTFSHTYNHSLDTYPYVNRLRPSKLSNITEKIKSNFTKTFIKDLEHQPKISTPSKDNNPQHPTVKHISTAQLEVDHLDVATNAELHATTVSSFEGSLNTTIEDEEREKRKLESFQQNSEFNTPTELGISEIVDDSVTFTAAIVDREFTTDAPETSPNFPNLATLYENATNKSKNNQSVLKEIEALRDIANKVEDQEGNASPTTISPSTAEIFHKDGYTENLNERIVSTSQHPVITTESQDVVDNFTVAPELRKLYEAINRPKISKAFLSENRNNRSNAKEDQKEDENAIAIRTDETEDDGLQVKAVLSASLLTDEVSATDDEFVTTTLTPLFAEHEDQNTTEDPYNQGIVSQDTDTANLNRELMSNFTKDLESQLDLGGKHLQEPTIKHVSTTNLEIDHLDDETNIKLHNATAFDVSENVEDSIKFTAPKVDEALAKNAPDLSERTTSVSRLQNLYENTTRSRNNQSVLKKIKGLRDFANKLKTEERNVNPTIASPSANKIFHKDGHIQNLNERVVSTSQHPVITTESQDVVESFTVAPELRKLYEAINRPKISKAFLSENRSNAKEDQKEDGNDGLQVKAELGASLLTDEINATDHEYVTTTLTPLFTEHEDQNTTEDPYNQGIVSQDTDTANLNRGLMSTFSKDLERELEVPISLHEQNIQQPIIKHISTTNLETGHLVDAANIKLHDGTSFDVSENVEDSVKFTTRKSDQGFTTDAPNFSTAITAAPRLRKLYENTNRSKNNQSLLRKEKGSRDFTKKVETQERNVNSATIYPDAPAIFHKGEPIENLKELIRSTSQHLAITTESQDFAENFTVAPELRKLYEAFNRPKISKAYLANNQSNRSNAKEDHKKDENTLAFGTKESENDDLQLKGALATSLLTDEVNATDDEFVTTTLTPLFAEHEDQNMTENPYNQGIVSPDTDTANLSEKLMDTFTTNLESQLEVPVFSGGKNRQQPTIKHISTTNLEIEHLDDAVNTKLHDATAFDVSGNVEDSVKFTTRKAHQGFTTNTPSLSKTITGASRLRKLYEITNKSKNNQRGVKKVKSLKDFANKVETEGRDVSPSTVTPRSTEMFHKDEDEENLKALTTPSTPYPVVTTELLVSVESPTIRPELEKLYEAVNRSKISKNEHNRFNVQPVQKEDKNISVFSSERMEQFIANGSGDDHLNVSDVASTSLTVDKINTTKDGLVTNTQPSLISAVNYQSITEQTTVIDNSIEDSYNEERNTTTIREEQPTIEEKNNGKNDDTLSFSTKQPKERKLIENPTSKSLKNVVQELRVKSLIEEEKNYKDKPKKKDKDNDYYPDHVIDIYNTSSISGESKPSAETTLLSHANEYNTESNHNRTESVLTNEKSFSKLIANNFKNNSGNENIAYKGDIADQIISSNNLSSNPSLDTNRSLDSTVANYFNKLNTNSRDIVYHTNIKSRNHSEKRLQRNELRNDVKVNNTRKHAVTFNNLREEGNVKQGVNFSDNVVVNNDYNVNFKRRFQKYHFNRSRYLTPTLHPITTGVTTTSTTTTEKYATKESQDSAHVASVKVNYLVDVEQAREIKEYNLESSTIIIPESTTPETLSSPAPTLRRIKILRHRRPLAGLTNNSYLPENVTSARITNTTTTANIETQNSDILSTVRQADEKLVTTDIKYLTKTHNNLNQTETFSLNTVTPPKRFRKIIRKIIKPMNLTNRPTITIKTTTETALTVKLTSTEPTILLSSGKKQNSSRHDYNRNIKIPAYQTKSNFDGKENNNENALNINKKNETLFAGKANKLNVQSSNQTLKGAQQDRYKNKASSVSTKETSSFDDDDDDDNDDDNDDDDDDDDDSYDENSDEQEEGEYENISDNVKEKNVHNREGEMQNKEDTEIEEDLQTTNDDDDIINLQLEKATYTPLTYTDELEVTENNQDTARDAKSRIENKSIDFTKELSSDIPKDNTGSNYNNKNFEKISIPPSKLNSTARKTVSKGLNVPNISQNGSQNDDSGKPLKTNNNQTNEREENNSFKLFATASDEETIASSLKTFGTKRTKDLADAKTNTFLVDASKEDEILNTELKKQVNDTKTEGETLTVQTLPETIRNSGEPEEQISVKTKIYSQERTAIQSSDARNIENETVSAKPVVRNDDNLDFYERNDDRKLIDAQILTSPEIGLTSEILQTTKRNLMPDTTIAPPSVRPTFRRKVIIKKPSLSVLPYSNSPSPSTAKVPTSDSTKKYTRPNGGRFVPQNANNRKSVQNYVKNDSRTPPTFSISRLKAQDTLKIIPNEEYSRGSGDGAEEIIAKRKNVEEHEEVVSVLRPAVAKQFPLSKKTNDNSSKINKQLESLEEDDDYDDGEIEDEDEDEEDEEEDDEEEEIESNRGTENSHNYLEKSVSLSQSEADKLPIATRPGGNIPFNSRLSNTPNRNESKNSYKNHSVETRAKSRSRIVNRPQGVAVPNLTIKPIALDFERTTVPVPTKPAPFVPSYTPSYERKYTGPSTEATALIDNINPLIEDLNIEALNARNKKIFDINSKKHTTLKPKLLIPTVKFSNQTNLESALESQVPNTVQNTAYEVHESYSSGQQSDGGFATTTTPKTLENTMGTNTEDKQHEYHINHDVNANEIFSQDHDNYLGLTTTQPPSTTLLHVFTLSDDEQSTRPSNSGADAIPRLIFERVRPKHKVIEINRVVEIHSKEEKLRRKSKANQIVPIGDPSPLKVESLPHVEQLGEISVVKYVHLVDGSDIKVEGHSTVTDYTPTESIIQKSSMPVRNSLPEDRESIDGILNQNDQYSPETSVIIRVSTSQESPPNVIQKRQGKALVPEVIREAVETSTISLEGLFENARKAKVSNTIDGTQKHIHINSQNSDAKIAVGSISTDSPEASDEKNMNISSNVPLIAWLNGSNGERQEIAVLKNSSLPFKNNDTEQKSTLSSQFIQEESTTIGPNLGNFKVSTVPTTLFPTYVRPIVPLLRPESNESSPLVISIANLDKVILSKVKKTDSPALLTNNLHSSIVNPSLLSKSPQNVRLSNSFATTNNDKTLDSPISDDSRGASSNRLVSYVKPSTNPAKHPNLTEKKSKPDTPTEMYSILEGSSVGSTTTSALGSKISEIISFSTETHVIRKKRPRKFNSQST